MNITKEELSKFITDPKWLEIIYRFFTREVRSQQLTTTEGDQIFRYLRHRKSIGKVIYPKPDKCFRSFNTCRYNDLQVVILGQDPYHGKDQADGLAFSSGIKGYCPPSLQNILKEVRDDIYPEQDLDLHDDFSLDRWARQGVLLLNTALTVEEGDPGTHSEVWREFTEHMINYINWKCPGVIFVLWGAHAKRFEKFISPNLHPILTANHPSPLSANKGGWFGNKHFSKINEIIAKNNGIEFCIKW